MSLIRRFWPTNECRMCYCRLGMGWW